MVGIIRVHMVEKLEAFMVKWNCLKDFNGFDVDKGDIPRAFHGVSLGYIAADLNTWSYDLTSDRIKTAYHVVYQEAHYVSNTRPPGWAAPARTALAPLPPMFPCTRVRFSRYDPVAVP
jgi:hypothetical protein